MATFNKVDSFIEKVFEGAINFSSDTFRIALSNVAPIAANDELADITQIANGNGYTTGGSVLTISSSSQTSGTYKAVAADLVYTASGGSMAAFRYAVVYDDTASGDPIVGWYDYGSSITLAVGETFTIDFDATNGLLQAA
jgi:hypothetical protein